MILKAAHGGAQAIFNSPQGHLMRMVSNVMVRVDVVLGAHWDAEDQISLWPMINEMDWFNSAAMLTNFWMGSLPSGQPNDGQELLLEWEIDGSPEQARAMLKVQRSSGFKVAAALHQEILHIRSS